MKPTEHQPKEIFKNPTLNKFTKTDSLLVIRAYFVISIAIYLYGFLNINSVSLIWKIILPILGLLFFTFIEYIVHRYLYHSGDDYLDENNWQFKIHGIHHSIPREKHYLAMPLILALIVAAILFGILSLALGANIYFFFPGFLAGYAIYLYMHFIIHTKNPPKNSKLKYLWTHHNIHHYKHDDKAFGVSSPLWDYIFGTMPKKEERI